MLSLLKVAESYTKKKISYNCIYLLQKMLNLGNKCWKKTRVFTVTMSASLPSTATVWSGHGWQSTVKSNGVMLIADKEAP